MSWSAVWFWSRSHMRMSPHGDEGHFVLVCCGTSWSRVEEPLIDVAVLSRWSTSGTSVSTHTETKASPELTIPTELTVRKTVTHRPRPAPPRPPRTSTGSPERPGVVRRVLPVRKPFDKSGSRRPSSKTLAPWAGFGRRSVELGQFEEQEE